ncbi:hypothetical protein EDC01DRAFT_775938 [Geopyxis carbonaria]|nr:hypothetical protein EDC01DRAFT_775938 [Geopyxis carbonaria]
MSSNSKSTTSTPTEDRTSDLVKAFSDVELQLKSISSQLVDSSETNTDFHEYDYDSESNYGSSYSGDVHYDDSHQKSEIRDFNDPVSENEFFHNLDKQIDEALELVHAWGKDLDDGGSESEKKKRSEKKPHFLLSRLNGAHGSVLSLDYVRVFAPLIPFTAARNRHWIVALSGSVLLAATFLITPLAAAAFGQKVVALETALQVNLSAPSADAELGTGSDWAHRGYGYVWHGVELPRFVTENWAVAGFEVQGSESGNWTVETTRYGGGLQCVPAVRETDGKDVYAREDTVGGCRLPLWKDGKTAWGQGLNNMIPHQSEFGAINATEECGKKYKFAAMWSTAPVWDADLKEMTQNKTAAMALRGSSAGVKASIHFKGRNFDMSNNRDSDRRPVANWEELQGVNTTAFEAALVDGRSESDLAADMGWKWNTTAETTSRRERVDIGNLTVTYPLPDRKAPALGLPDHSDQLGRVSLFQKRTKEVQRLWNSTNPDFKINVQAVPPQSIVPFGLAMLSADTDLGSLALDAAKAAEMHNRAFQLLFAVAMDSILRPSELTAPASAQVTTQVPVASAVWLRLLQASLAYIAILSLILGFVVSRRPLEAMADPGSILWVMRAITESPVLLSDLEGSEWATASETSALLAKNGHYHLAAGRLEAVGRTRPLSRIVSDGSSRVVPPHPTPPALKPWVGVAAVVGILGMIIALAVAYRKDILHHGLNIHSEAAATAVFKLLPVLAVMVLELFVALLWHFAAAEAPYKQLHAQACHPRVLAINYHALPQLQLVKALRNRHARVALLSVAAMAANILVVAMAGAVRAEIVEVQGNAEVGLGLDVGAGLDHRRLAEYLDLGASATAEQGPPDLFYAAIAAGKETQEVFFPPLQAPTFAINGTSLTTEIAGLSVRVKCSTVRRSHLTDDVDKDTCDGTRVYPGPTSTASGTEVSASLQPARHSACAGSVFTTAFHMGTPQGGIVLRCSTAVEQARYSTSLNPATGSVLEYKQLGDGREVNATDTSLLFQTLLSKIPILQLSGLDSSQLPTPEEAIQAIEQTYRSLFPLFLSLYSHQLFPPATANLTTPGVLTTPALRPRLVAAPALLSFIILLLLLLLIATLYTLPRSAPPGAPPSCIAHTATTVYAGRALGAVGRHGEGVEGLSGGGPTEGEGAVGEGEGRVRIGAFWRVGVGEGRRAWGVEWADEVVGK